MRNIALSIAVILCTFSHSSAQNNDEIAILRTYLSIPDAVPISLAKSPELPTERPLKVYINASDDSSVSQSLMQLIQEINKKRENKYGPIEVVTDVSKASLILIHYELTGKRRQEMKTALSMDPALGRGKTDYVIKTEVRGYIVARKAGGVEILSRYMRQVIVGEQRKEMRDAFMRLLKEQGKSEKR